MVEEGGAGLSGPLEDGFVSASSPAGPSAWFVCGGPNGTRPYKGPAWFFALSFVNALLFLVHHQVPASRMPPFRPDLRQIQTLHSIMTTGVHCILPQPGRQATEPRTQKSDGAKEFLLDRGKKRSKTAE